VVLLIAIAAIISFATITTLWLLHPKVALAATFTVNSTADAVDANPGDGVCDDGIGKCTLRAAIMEANALVGPDTVTLPAGTYNLTIPGSGEDAAATGDLDISRDLTINGAGQATTTIDGGGLDRVLHVHPAAVLNLAHVTVRNGISTSGGGGIYNHGVLTLEESKVLRNETDTVGGGGIYNDGGGTLTVTNTTISDNSAVDSSGGGINNSGTLTINDSTISDNAANWAGGIHNQGRATVINSTISGNLVDRQGGGIYGIRSGGSPYSTTIISSTITNNTAIDRDGGLGNGPFDVVSTVIALNSGGDCSGGITSLGYNLASDGTCGLIQPTDLPAIDPLVGPLQDNGGPTLTHALLSGSPAIDHIPTADCTDANGDPVTTDQRGVARPQGIGCDVGAFEATLEVSFDLHQDPSDGATGLKIYITQVTSSVTGSGVAVPLEGFQAQLIYDSSCVNLLDIREMDFTIAAQNITNDATGSATFNGFSAVGVAPPADLGHALTRLTGSAVVPCSLTMEITDLTDVDGNSLVVEPPSLSMNLLRGDARADGNVTIADALYIAQYLVGLRPACTDMVDTTCVHSVNAASVRHDGAFDRKTIADALFIAQRLVGLRDEFFNLVGG